MSPRSPRIWLLLFSFAVGCSRPEKNAPTETSASAQANSPKTEASEKTAPAPKKKPAKPKSKPLDSQEKSGLESYRAAMKKGRSLTLSKDWEGAIGAFDLALKAEPDDARALSERGYAKLLAKKWDDARRDLDRAQKRATDRILQAQICYNLGLVAEGKGDAAAASEAFAKSNELHPTAAAKKKLEGKSACAATVVTAPSKATEYPTWKALYDALAKSYEADMANLDDKPADEVSAKQVLCEEAGGCKGDGPFIVWIGQPLILMRWSVVQRNAAGVLVAFESNEAGMGGRCTWRPDVKIASHEGLVHVLQRGSPMIPEFVNTEGGPCAGDEPGGCLSACLEDSWEQVDAVYDFEKKERIVRVEQNAVLAKNDTEGKAPAEVRVKGKTVEISGGSCDRQIP